MRSGLLAVGVILLVLGAIFYFVPTPASDAETASVTTETFNTFGNNTNETNTTTTTVSDTETRENTAFSTGFDDETEVVRFGDGDPVAYVYLDDNGDMYNEEGEFLGEGISGTDMTTRVADTYGTSAQTQTVSDSGMQSDSWQTQTVSDTQTDTQSGQAGVYGQSDTETSQRQTVSDTDSGFNDPDTFGDAEDNGLNTAVVDERENTAEATSGVMGSSWLRTLAILSMVLGAILTILGLVLPDNRVDVDARARTAGPAGRRVRYEREEERHIRK